MRKKEWKRVSVFVGGLTFVLLMTFAGCGGGGGGEKSETSAPVAASSFSLASNPEELSAAYRDVATESVVRVSFTEPLQSGASVRALPRKSDTPPGVRECLPLRNDWLRLFEEGEKVDGELYLCNGKRELLFVPSKFLPEGRSFKVLVSAETTSAGGESLGKDVVFDLTVRRDRPPVEVKGPDLLRENENGEFTVEARFTPWRSEWTPDVYEQTSQKIEEEGPLFLRYETEGDHRLAVRTYDPYGRNIETEKNVTVLCDAEEKLRGIPGVSDVAEEDPSNLEDSALRNVAEANGQDVVETLSGTTGSLNASSMLRGVRKPKTFHALQLRPDKALSFKNRYVRELIEKRAFLGIALFGGVPTIFSYEEIDGGEKYRIFGFADLSQTALDVEETQRRILLHRPKGTPSPLSYSFDFTLDAKTFERLRDAFPPTVIEALPILSVTEKGIFLHIPVREESTVSRSIQTRNLIQDGWNKVKEYGTQAVATAEDVGSELLDTLENLASVVGYDTLNTFKTFKELVKKIQSLHPVDNIDGYQAIASRIKTGYDRLQSGYRNAEGILEDATDPDRLLKDLKNFLSKGDENVKDFFETSFAQLEAKKESLNHVIDVLKAHRSDVRTFIETFVPDPRKDAQARLLISNGMAYISLQNGASFYTISVDTVLSCKNYIKSFLDYVGDDFPIDTLYTALDTLVKSFPDYAVTLRYDASAGELLFFAKENATSDTRCPQESEATACFDTLLSPDRFDSTFLMAASPGSDNRLILTFDPFAPFAPEIEGEDALANLYNKLQQHAPSFPEITADLQLVYRGNRMQIAATTHPDISLSASAGIAVEFDYHVAVGGSATAGLSFGVGVDPLSLNAVEMETLKNIVLEEFNATRQSMGLVLDTIEENGTKAGVMLFADDQTFITFLKNYATGIKTALSESNLSRLAQSISFSVSFEPEIAAGVGAGGTGTGGGRADLKVGAEVGLSWDLELFADSLAVELDAFDIDSFFLTPMKKLGKILQKAAQEGAQSGDPVAAFLHQNPVQQAAAIFKETFVELIDKMKNGHETALQNLYKEMAERMTLSIGLEIGEEAEGEEVVSVEETLEWQPSLAINGEALFNIIQNIAGNSETAPYLDHLGIYPEIYLGYPFTASIEVGFDEGVKVSFGGAFQADFINGTFTIKSDPFVTASNGESVATQNINLKPDVIVRLSADNLNPDSGQNVTLTCSVTSTATPVVNWYIEGEKVEGTGDFYYGDNIIAHVASMTGTTMTFSPHIPGDMEVACLASAENAYGMDALTVTRQNHAPTVPTLSLLDNAVVAEDGNISFETFDSDGDPMMYEIQISTSGDFDPDHTTTYTTSSTVFTLPESLNGHEYYIRIRAGDGSAWSGWSATKHIYYKLDLGYTIGYTDKDGAYHTADRVVITDIAEPGIEISLDSEDYYTNGAELKICKNADLTQSCFTSYYDYTYGDGFQRWMPEECGLYYVGVRFHLGDTSDGRWVTTATKTLSIIPPAPVPAAPASNATFHHRAAVTFSVQEVGDETLGFEADGYGFEYSASQSFSSDLNDSGVLTANEWHTLLPTLTKPPYSRTYYWRARARCQGVWSDWSAPRPFIVKNRPPVPTDGPAYYLNGSTTQTVGKNIHICIDDRIKIWYTFEDPDGDAIGGALFSLSKASSPIVEHNVSAAGPAPSLGLETEYNASEVGYGTAFVKPQAYDLYGATLSLDWYEENRESAGIFTVVNCAPDAPDDDYISGPGPTQVIITGQELFFTASHLRDPDGDPIPFARLGIVYNGNTTILEANLTESGQAIWHFTPTEAGAYGWWIQAVSQAGETLQYGEESDDHLFTVLPPPPAVPVAPEDGAILFDDTNASVHLSATVPPEINASLIRAYQFEWSTTESFEESTTSSHVTPEEAEDFATSMSAGTDWYWRVRASYTVSDGPWSEPRCLSYWKSSAIREYRPLARVELLAYDESDGTVSIRVEPLEVMKSCRGSYGTIYYDISSDENGTDSVTKGVLDENGTVTFKKAEGVDRYYLAIRQEFDRNHATDYGDRVAFSLAAATLETVGYWSFDECDATDFASGHRGEVIGEPTCYDSNLMESGRMLYFHGDEEGLGIDFAPDLNLSSFTISLWLKPMETNNTFPLFGPLDGSGYGLRIVDGKPEGYLNIEGGEAPFQVRGVALPTGVWSHLLLTYDGMKLTLYQNGKVAGSVVAYGTPKVTREDFGIAIQMGGEEESRFFKGYLEEVKLYEGTVDAEKANAIMHERVKENEEFFLPLETVGAKPLSGDLPLEVTFYVEPSDSGVYLWDFEGSGYYDKSQLSAKASHTYRRVGTYEAVVMRESPGGDWQRMEINVTAPANMIAYWSMDDCSPDDATGKHVTERHGDVQCMAKGVNEEALKFDGSSAYLRAYGKSDLTPADLTISLWFQTNGEPGRQSLLHYGSYDIEYEEGVVYAHIRLSGGEGPVELYEKADVEPGSWVHVAVTFDRHDFILYINGEKVSATTAEGVLAGTDGDLYLAAGGADESTGAPVDPYEGALDEVYLFNEVLSAEELEKL